MTSLLRVLKSKSESRNPKHIRNHTLECFNLETAVGRKKAVLTVSSIFGISHLNVFRISRFGFRIYFRCVSDFDIRVSDLASDISAFVIVGSQV